MERHLPQSTLRVGARVKVHLDLEYGDGPWPGEPTGIAVEHPLAPQGQSWREALTPAGLKRFYWIVFDTPQRDADGDGLSIRDFASCASRITMLASEHDTTSSNDRQRATGRPPNPRG